jgi:DNA modification methylase
MNNLIVEGAKIDVVITDPPYGIAGVWKGGSGKGWSKADSQKEKRNQWDNIPSETAMKTILQLRDNQIIWGGNYFNLPVSRGWLVWVKPERNFTLSEAELAWTSISMPMRVFECRRSDPDRTHPTQKPLALMRWCVEKFSAPGDTVCDPYMGSGTTGVACAQLNRNFIGIEIDPEYYASSQKRIAQAESQMVMF